MDETTDDTSANPGVRRRYLERLRDLCARTGMGKTLVYEKLKPTSPHHDAKFPEPVEVSKNMVAWYADEVDAWMANLPRRRSSN